MKNSHKIIITLSVLLLTGYTWSLDMPLALQVPLRQSPYYFSNFDFNFIYFATYITICFSDMPVGMLLDKLPIKKTILIIALISLIAQIGVLLMFYLQFQGYKIMIYLFRGIFGVTGQALFTIQALLISKYGGKYYDMLIGVGICAPLIFDSINNIVTPSMFDSTKSMELVWGIGVLFCTSSFIFAFIIARLVQKQQKRQSPLTIHEQINDASNQNQGQNKQKQQQKQGQLNFNGLRTMPMQFWVIAGAVFFTQNLIATYIDNLNDLLVKRFKIPYVNAGYLMCIPFGLAAFMSFFLGLILDKKPKLRRKIIVSATIFFSMGILTMYFLPNIDLYEQTPFSYYFLIIIQLLSVSYLIAIEHGVLSSALVYIVSEKHLGIAWGVIGSAIGLSQAIGPLMVAWILETQNNLADGYKKLTLYAFCISFLPLGFSLWIRLGSFQNIDVNSIQKCLQYDKLHQSLISSSKQSENTVQTV